MRRLDPIDSKSGFVRLVERWKRGITASVIVTLCGLAGLLAYGVTDAVLSLVSLNPLLEAGLRLGVGATAFLWLLGDRETLRIIGNISKIADAAD